MTRGLAQNCAFETDRLVVGPWHGLADDAGMELGALVANMLTKSTTVALPEAWHGDYSAERALAWIDERDRESPTLLMIDRENGQPVGLVILFEAPTDGVNETCGVDLRIGYLLAEPMWGQGLASELIAGITRWGRAHPSVRTLTGGVALTNPASARVLLKNGFEPTGQADGGEQIYQISFPRSSDHSGKPQSNE